MSEAELIHAMVSAGPGASRQHHSALEQQQRAGAGAVEHCAVQWAVRSPVAVHTASLSLQLVRLCNRCNTKQCSLPARCLCWWPVNAWCQLLKIAMHDTWRDQHVTLCHACLQSSWCLCSSLTNTRKAISAQQESQAAASQAACLLSKSTLAFEQVMRS